MEGVTRCAQTMMAPTHAAVIPALLSLTTRGLVQVRLQLDISVKTCTNNLYHDLAINACLEGSNNCDQLCSANNDGTFTCSCETGFVLDQDGSSCNGKNSGLLN